MTLTSSASLLEQLNWRYAVKRFDSTKTLTDSQWQTLEESLVLTPSSYGLQPWKFIVLKDRALRESLVEHSWGQNQVVDRSHFVVFTVLKQMAEKHVNDFVDRIAEVRGAERSALQGYENMRIGDVIKGPRASRQQEWMSRQCYIALGNLMTCAALMGIDTCPMEGIVPQKYDEILGLEKQGLMTVLGCAVGFRHSEDAYAKAKKVRFETSRLVEIR